MLQTFKKHLFSITIVTLLVLSISSSYLRFMVNHDYSIRYEGDCDPYTESCFMYCEDEECTEPFFYYWITREANDVFNNCGKDVTTCDYAYECSSQNQCEIEYCDPNENIDECESLSLNDTELERNKI